MKLCLAVYVAQIVKTIIDFRKSKTRTTKISENRKKNKNCFTSLHCMFNRGNIDEGLIKHLLILTLLVTGLVCRILASVYRVSVRVRARFRVRVSIVPMALTHRRVTPIN